MQSDKPKMELDVANMWKDAVGPEQGLDRDKVGSRADEIAGYTKDIASRRGDDIGFMELPYKDEVTAAIKDHAAGLRDWCKNFVVLGIGGSALGNITVHKALNHPNHNLLPDGHRARGNTPRIFVLDNVDPYRISGLMDIVSGDLEHTGFNVITKSGSTAETMSQFLFVRDLLKRTDGCDPARQMTLTTDKDPAKSLLRRLSQDEGYEAFTIPDNVGGRFSVLTPVGLLSAAVSGVDIDALLRGAARMNEACKSEDLWENPAALYALTLHMQYKAGKNISVLMPYSHALRGLADWYCQLWAESLGKKDGVHEDNVFTGPTPVGSVGVTDQHSVMQLYQDGPFDKVLTLVEAEDTLEEKLDICRGEAEEELSYLATHSFNELFAAELEATRCALREKNRPNCTLRIPTVSAETLGELFMFFEYAVTYSGYLYDVNPFDQPGVELGKEYTYGLMGREGYSPPDIQTD